MTQKQTDIVNYIQSHPALGRRAVAREFGVSRHVVYRAMQAWKWENNQGYNKVNGMDSDIGTSSSFEEDDNRIIITTRSPNITTLGQALAYSKVDLSIWEVERHIINYWDVTMGKQATDTGKPETYTNFQIKVWLRRKTGESAEEVFNRLIEKAKTYAPKYPMIVRPPLPKGERFMYEMAVLADPHIARMTWGKETGMDWDTKIATAVLVNATDELLVRAKPYPIEKILIPVGNDTFEINDDTNTTPKNHNALYVDGRYIQVFERGVECLKQIVDHCLEIAPVELIWVQGNHDPQISLHLVRELASWYHHEKDVSVDVTPPKRKCVIYGKTFLGFTHGVGLKLNQIPAIFMSEFRDKLYGCNHIEIHLGHTHQMKDTNVLTGSTEGGGVRVRVLQSLTARSNWEYEMGFSNNQAGEAFLWSNVNGYYGHFSVPARPPEDK